MPLAKPLDEGPDHEMDELHVLVENDPDGKNSDTHNVFVHV